MAQEVTARTEVLGSWKWSQAPCKRRIERISESYVMFSWCDGMKEERKMHLKALGSNRFVGEQGRLIYEITPDGFLVFLEDGHIHSVWQPGGCSCETGARSK